MFVCFSFGSGEELREEASVIGGSDDETATLKKMIDEKRKNSETYSYYMDNGVKYVTGAARYKKLVETGEEQPMNVASTTDEALALIIYENYEDKWMDEYNDEETKRGPKYTQREGSYRGEWSDEGIERFNQLVKEVREDRDSTRGKKAEEAYQMQKVAAAMTGRRKRRKVTPESKVRVVNDLVDDSDDSSDDDEH